MNKPSLTSRCYSYSYSSINELINHLLHSIFYSHVSQIAARIGAKTVDLRDKSLLKENRPSSVEADVQQPQLMRAGPLGLEISAALLTSPSIERGAPENSQECVDKPLSMAGRSLRETLEMPTEMLERWFGREVR